MLAGLGAIAFMVTCGIILNRTSETPATGNTPAVIAKERPQGQGEHEAEARFNALTPAEHLSEAKSYWKSDAPPEALEEALGHVRAIPQSSPEAKEAKSLETKLIRAKHLASAKRFIDSAPTDDLRASHDALQQAGGEIQEVLQRNPNDKDALRLLTLATNKGKEALAGSRQTRELFAQELQQKVAAMGFDMNVWVPAEGNDRDRELNVDSEMFTDTATRVEFITTVLPQWQKDLCRVGFRQVRLRQGGTFDLGRDYPLSCQGR